MMKNEVKENIMEVEVRETEWDTFVTIKVSNAKLQMLKNIGFLLNRLFDHLRMLVLEQPISRPTIVQTTHILRNEVDSWGL